MKPVLNEERTGYWRKKNWEDSHQANRGEDLSESLVQI